MNLARPIYVAVLAISLFASCEKDDNPSPANITGVWLMTSSKAKAVETTSKAATAAIRQDIVRFTETYRDRFTFYKNGTALLETADGMILFDYTYSGNLLTTTEEELGKETKIVRINGNSMEYDEDETDYYDLLYTKNALGIPDNVTVTKVTTTYVYTKIEDVY